jgi:hypothetical protein
VQTIIGFIFSAAAFIFSDIQEGFVVVVKKTFRYSNNFSTTVHPLMPQFRNSEHYYEKRYKKPELAW